jgi:hypothetical protein
MGSDASQTDLKERAHLYVFKPIRTITSWLLGAFAELDSEDAIEMYHLAEGE